MAEKTTNYGLTKPLPEEFYDVGVQNGNMDILDTALKDIERGAAPAGYGLGELTGGVCNDCNTAVRNGWYNINTSTQNCPVIDGIEHSVAALFVIGRTTRIWQTLYSYVSGAHVILQRYSLDRGTTWTDWVDADPSNYVPLAGGTITGNIVSNTSAKGFVCAVDGHDVRLMANNGGNRGLYDNVEGKWLLLKDASNNVTLNGNATTATTATKANTMASGAILLANCGQWSGNIAASGYTSTQYITPTARSGYTFLGVVTYSSSSSYFCCYGLIYYNSKIQIYGRNINSKAIDATVDVYGLYVKN